MVLKRGVEPGESEYSHGRGLMPPEERGYVPEQIDILRADLRTDTADPGSTRDYYALGNPDRYGANPAFIREKGKSMPSKVDVTRPGGVPGAVVQTKVVRHP